MYIKDKCIGLYVIALVVLLLLGIMAIKVRETSDKVDKVAEQIATERALEICTTQTTTETQIEPGDDKIVIEIRGEFKGGVYH